MSRFDQMKRLAKIELYKGEDGTYGINYIHWIGKKWDGLHEYVESNEDDIKMILSMCKKPDLPDKCTDCEFCFFQPFSDHEFYWCRLNPYYMKDHDWKNCTPEWCPLKDENNESRID